MYPDDVTVRTGWIGWPTSRRPPPGASARATRRLPGPWPVVRPLGTLTSHTLSSHTLFAKNFALHISASPLRFTLTACVLGAEMYASAPGGRSGLCVFCPEDQPGGKRAVTPGTSKKGSPHDLCERISDALAVKPSMISLSTCVAGTPCWCWLTAKESDGPPRTGDGPRSRGGRGGGRGGGAARSLF